MQNLNFKSILPVIVGILIFIILSWGFFPPLMKGKVIQQSDMIQNKGMAKEINDHRDKYHEEPLWTNSMFGGMPAYQISITYPSNLMTPVRNFLMLGFPTPANFVFMYMLGFFVLMLVLKVDKWLAIVGSIGFGFSAFFFLIIDAGHNTQALAIAYMAPVFAGVIMVCRGQYLLGGSLLGVSFALELVNNHPQIAYYLVLLCAVYVAFEWIARIRKREFKEIFKALTVFIIAGVLAIGCNIANLWSSYDYGKLTIRGPSELTPPPLPPGEKRDETGGVDKKYATQWSLGKSETMTLLIPGFKGRSSSVMIGENKDALKNVDRGMKDVVASTGQYWGDQPFTDSPYSGAIICFLFVIGLFIIPGRMKWALLLTSILAVMLAWGHNFMDLTSFFLDYFPGYNKFRAVTMILVLAEFAIPLLAILAVDKMLKDPDVFRKPISLEPPQLIPRKIRMLFEGKSISFQRVLIIAFAFTGGLALLFFIAPGLCDFTGVNDIKLFEFYKEKNGEDVAQQVMDNVVIAREALFRSEALRSFFFASVAALLIWLLSKQKIGKSLFIPVLGIFVLVDLALVDKTYLNDKDFTNKKEAVNPFPMYEADKQILKDKDPNYRVLDLTDTQNGPFNTARASYYHKTIGGYHAAKLRRYQELIEAHIGGEIQDIIRTFNENPTDSSLRAAFARQGVLNMLNMRYLIYNPEAPPLQNRYALGNAWFVNELKMVKNADEELKEVGEIDPRRTAVVDERWKAQLEGFTPKPDPSATIKLTEYRPNLLKYESTASSEQLAVFSEIYYKDWNMYVDGQKKDVFAADWVLRAARIPAGKHNIEFRFEPQKYIIGEKVSLASCLGLFGFLGVSLFMVWKKKGG